MQLPEKIELYHNPEKGESVALILDCNNNIIHTLRGETYNIEVKAKSKLTELYNRYVSGEDLHAVTEKINGNLWYKTTI